MKPNYVTIFAMLAAAVLWSPAALAAPIPAQQAYLKASNTGGSDRFGRAVAVSGETVVIGADGEDPGGAAYVFVRSAGMWTQQAYLKTSNAGGSFGYSVAVSGDTVIVGAWSEDSNASGVNGNQNDNSAHDSGAAYVFVRSGTNWTQQAYLKASNTDAEDRFGWSVAVAGETVVVGAYLEQSNATGANGDQSNNGADNSGAAYVFVRSGTNWTQQAYLKASNTDAEDRFGWSVAVAGDTAVVGAPLEQSSATGVNGDQTNNSADNAGAAYVFVRNGTNWSQQDYLKASNTGRTDNFGWSVAVSGDTVAVGAPLEQSNATGVNGDQTNNSADNAGAAYVFVRSGTNWSQQGYLKASNTGGTDQFGYFVSASGDTVVVGAYLEDADTTGVNGNQNDTAQDAGAAYVFLRSGANWSQQAYLKASNSRALDYFGCSAAVSGDTVVVGAYGEDSNARGVNGNQNDNSLVNPGAAYIFTGFCQVCSRLLLVPDDSSGYLIYFNGVPGSTYRLQRAPSVTGPWTILATLTAPASGLLQHQDTSLPSGQAYYRTVQP